MLARLKILATKVVSVEVVRCAVRFAMNSGFCEQYFFTYNLLDLLFKRLTKRYDTNMIDDLVLHTIDASQRVTVYKSSSINFYQAYIL